MFWVISVYFNLRNILPKSGTFRPGHPVYIHGGLDGATYRKITLITVGPVFVPTEAITSVQIAFHAVI